jgi:dTDP-4-amino-4,6-dideoxygalactose transaminase
VIPVTKPFLPPKEEVYKLLDDVWRREWLTNNGPLVNQFELMLKEYLKVPNLLFLNNGTIALQIAIKALDLNGEIITTPFSYVATTNSILWEGCKPVFVDIDVETFNIDPRKIEDSITVNTTAILATHVFGNPCDIDAIEKIATKYSLKVIYDAAHCFGTKYKGKSVFAFGDISTTSFHATKLFHTVEGGAVFCNCPELLKKMAYLRNFGHNGPEDFALVGINGKNSEFHAAMGIANFPYINQILEARKRQSLRYGEMLKGLRVKYLSINTSAEFNYAYFPIVFETETNLLKAVAELNSKLITPRRYFYPSLNNLQYLNKQEAPVSEDISKTILCLPLFYDLSNADIDTICEIILRSQND